MLPEQTEHGRWNIRSERVLQHVFDSTLTNAKVSIYNY